MLLSLLLVFASLGKAAQVQAREHLTINVKNRVMLTRMYAIEFVRRLNAPHWLKLYGPNRKTHMLIDDMLANQKPVKLLMVPTTGWVEINPMTREEVLVFFEATRGVSPEQRRDLWDKFAASRELPNQKGVK